MPIRRPSLHESNHARDDSRKASYEVKLAKFSSFSLFTLHFSLFTFHFSLFTFHFSLFHVSHRFLTLLAYFATSAAGALCVFRFHVSSCALRGTLSPKGGAKESERVFSREDGKGVAGDRAQVLPCFLRLFRGGH